MKTLAVCSPNFSQSYNLKTFDLLGEAIYLSLIDYPDINDFKQLSSTQVLIKIKAFSCNYRDKSIMLTTNKIVQKNNKTYMYFGFGSEFVAEVLDVGESVKSLKKGDRVIPDASYPFREKKEILFGIPTNFASQRFQVFDEEQLIKIPEIMPDEVAASFTIMGHTVFSMLRRLELKKGNRILVTAASSNTSLGSIIALQKKGMRIFALSTNMENKSKLLQLGVEKVIPHQNLFDHKMEDYIGSEKFEAVIDPFFDLHFCHLVDYLRFEAKYITCGLYKQHPLFGDKKNESENYISALATCITRNIKFMGNCLGNQKDIRDAIQSFMEGDFNIIIDSVFTGEEIIPFLEKSFNNKQKRFGKVVYKY